MIKNLNTFKNLMYLLATFVSGLILLIGLHLFFLNLMDDLDKQTVNIENKLQIGEYIAEDLFKVQSHFYALATTTNSQKARNIVIDKISKIKDNINESLNILEQGGVLKRFIRLNVAKQANMVKKISYYPKNENTISLEAIDIRPKLIELTQMVKELDSLLALRAKYQKQRDSKNYTKTAKKIRRNYKSSPAFFTRATENIRRLLYEGEQEMRVLQTNVNTQKQFYSTLEAGIIIFVIGLVLVLGFIIAKQINKNNRKLQELNDDLSTKMHELAIQEASIRGILDAQDSIIIVTNGIEMLDSNIALIDFFEQYKDFQQFKAQHSCVCDFFKVNNDDDTYIVNKDYDGDIWLDYILKYPNIDFKVLMNNSSEDHHFAISANKKIIDEEGKFIIVVSLNDITAEIKSQYELQELNENLELIVEHKTKELQELNENLEQKVIVETQKVRDKDKQMTQQARFAALGEMIGNIAHQWRQPLSAINTTASGMQLQMQLGLTNDEEVQDSYSKIMGYVDFLTQTIEDFRGFFKEDKEKIDFNISDVVLKTISITSATYKDHNIELVNSSKEDEVFISYGMPSELSQVFLNVLNNAKDATMENNIEDKFVHIRIKVENGFNVIYIQDNAGGIPKKIMDKIFDPYFTTKHQAQGTGIGLYMSKDIIEKHMGGKISVKNMKTKLDSQLYDGACFKIVLPIVES